MPDSFNPPVVKNMNSTELPLETTVFYRNGRYYFVWSEYDSIRRCFLVKYGMADHLSDPVDLPDHNTIVFVEMHDMVFSQGWCSVIQFDGMAEWYLILHYLHFVQTVAGSPKTHKREVCIYKLGFNENGIDNVLSACERNGPRLFHTP